MADASTHAKNGIAPYATFDIVVDGRSILDESAGMIAAVTVEDDLGLPGAFSFEVGEVEVSGKGKATWLDDDKQFALGSQVEIKLGYGDRIATVIRGEITALEPSYAVHHMPRLTVRGYDKRHRLQRGTHTRSYQKLSDSDIVTKLAQDAGVPVKVESSSITHEYLLQANQSDLDFLNARAEAINFELLMIDGKLSFRPVAYGAGKTLTLTVGNELQELFLSCTLAALPSQHEARSWDVKTKEALVGKAGAGDETSRMGGKTSGAAQADKIFGTATRVTTASPVVQRAEIDALAARSLSRANLALISAEGRCAGLNDLRAGSVIEIAEAGKRYSGLYYIHSVRHHYDLDSGYETRFQGRRNSL